MQKISQMKNMEDYPSNSYPLPERLSPIALLIPFRSLPISVWPYSPWFDISIDKQTKIISQIPSDLKTKLPNDVIGLMIFIIHYYTERKRIVRENPYKIGTKEDIELSDKIENDRFDFLKQGLEKVGFTDNLVFEPDISQRGGYGYHHGYVVSYNVREPAMLYSVKYPGSTGDDILLYNSITIRISDIGEYYSVKIDKNDMITKKHAWFFEGQTEQEKKWLQGINEFMTSIGYKLIDPALLDIPVPVQGDLHSSIPTPEDGICTDGIEAYDGPYTVADLLFGEG